MDRSTRKEARVRSVMTPTVRPFEAFSDSERLPITLPPFWFHHSAWVVMLVASGDRGEGGRGAALADAESCSPLQGVHAHMRSTRSTLMNAFLRCALIPSPFMLLAGNQWMTA